MPFRQQIRLSSGLSPKPADNATQYELCSDILTSERLLLAEAV